MAVLDDRANKIPNKPMPQSWDRVVDMLPTNDWNVTKAAYASKCFSESYVSTQLVPRLNRDPRFNKTIHKLKTKIQRKQGFDPERIKQEYVKQYDKADENGDISNAKGVLDSLSKINGMFIDKILTYTEEVKPMTPAERAIMSRLAKIYLDSKFSNSAEMGIIDSDTGETPQLEELDHGL